MLNIIKMDLYRMLKTKSMYVIWIVLAAILLITTSLCKTDYELLTENDAMKQEQVTEPTVDNINVGIMVTLPTEPGEKVTAFTIFFFIDSVGLCDLYHYSIFGVSRISVLCKLT